MKRALYPILIFVTLVLIIALFSIPERSQCQLDDIVLKSDNLPSGWTVEWYVDPPALSTRGADQAMNVVFWKGKNDNVIVQNTVYIYRNRLLATLLYWINDKVFFPVNLTHWTDVRDSNSWDINSDSRKVRCSSTADPQLANQCVAVLRYGAVISDLIVPINDKEISKQEFVHMIQSIDQQIQSCNK